MNEITKDGSDFVGYEYKEVIAGRDKASLYLDGYMNFGWNLDGNIQPSIIGGRLYIKLKRDRKILNKPELTRLQRHFEACLNEIETMEKSKSQPGTIWSLIIGIIGTAFMAGSVFAVVADPPQIILCIILGIPAIIGWALPNFIYKKLLRKQIEKITPLVEEKFDEIYQICEKGSNLL